MSVEFEGYKRTDNPSTHFLLLPPLLPLYRRPITESMTGPEKRLLSRTK